MLSATTTGPGTAQPLPLAKNSRRGWSNFLCIRWSCLLSIHSVPTISNNTKNWTRNRQCAIDSAYVISHAVSQASQRKSYARRTENLCIKEQGSDRRTGSASLLSAQRYPLAAVGQNVPLDCCKETLDLSLPVKHELSVVREVALSWDMEMATYHFAVVACETILSLIISQHQKARRICGHWTFPFHILR